MDSQLDLGIEKSQTAMGMAMAHDRFRDQVLYQPRGWFNARHKPDGEFEGRAGDLMVHFQWLDGDKWTAMAAYLSKVAPWGNPWEVELSKTAYVQQATEYWARVRLAYKLTWIAQDKDDDNVRGASERLIHVARFEADDAKSMNDALDLMKSALHLPDSAV